MGWFVHISEAWVYSHRVSMFKMLKVKGEYTMKKALIIANMLFASATVFGMQQRDDDSSMSYGRTSNTPYYLPWPPRVQPERVNLFVGLTERRPSINSEQLTALVNSLVAPRLNDSTQNNHNFVETPINDSTQDNHNLVRTLVRDLTSDLISDLTSDDSVQNHYDAERRSLDLSNQNLTSIPFGVREIKDLEELDLSNNRVEALLFLPNNIRKLNISGNNLSHMPLGIFGLEGLEELDLSNNKLTSLCRGIFEFPPRNLKKLNISGNDLESLGSLLSFPNLEELTLDGWSLKYIPDDRIESITNIYGVNEGKVDPEYLANLIVNKTNNLYSGNKLLLQALGGVCTVKLKRL